MRLAFEKVWNTSKYVQLKGGWRHFTSQVSIDNESKSYHLLDLDFDWFEVFSLCKYHKKMWSN